MRKALDYANAGAFYLGQDAAEHAAAKVYLLERTQELLNQLLRMDGAYDVLSKGSMPRVAYWRGCTGVQGVGLGALDPDPISDLTVGGVRRGRLIREPDVDNWEGLLYGFDAEKRLRVVKHGSSQNVREVTFVSYGEKQAVGYRFNCRLKEPYSIFVCDYGDDRRILHYASLYILYDARHPERSQACELYDAAYDYEAGLLTGADERRVLYCEPPDSFFSGSTPLEERCLMKRRVYRFQIDEKGYYVSWRCRDYDGDEEIAGDEDSPPVPIRRRSRAHSQFCFVED